jgi:hypothetical protein
VPSGDLLIPPDSAVYREFVRLYRIARALRSTPVDRWNGELHATDASVWGSVSPLTGAIRLSAKLVLPHLTRSTSHQHPVEQAEALVTVLHESTHTGMELKALTEPNAVHSRHSLGLTEGVAEVRAVEDFQAFTWRAGYLDVVLPGPQYEGAYAATDRLLDQASGPFASREQLTDELVAGPAAMHFDRLAGGVIRNRLWDVVPHHENHQRAVRAALIRPMLHHVWPELPDQPTSIGERVAEEIRMGLDAKVDEIRQHYRYGGWRVFDADGRTADRDPGGSRPGRREGAAADVASGLRFLNAQAPAGTAVMRSPLLGQGARRMGSAPIAGHESARE